MSCLMSNEQPGSRYVSSNSFLHSSSVLSDENCVVGRMGTEQTIESAVALSSERFDQTGRKCVTDIGKLCAGRRRSEHASDVDSLEQARTLVRCASGHEDQLICWWWWHVDTGTDEGHQNKRRDACATCIERHHISRNPHNLAIVIGLHTRGRWLFRPQK